MKQLIFAATLILMFVACNPQKKINKAVQTVLTDSSAFERVGQKYVEVNPCVPTQGITRIVRDTSFIPFIVTKTDTVEVKDILGEDFMNERVKSAFDLGVAYCDEFHRSNPPKTRVDSFIVTLPDLQREKILNDKFNAKSNELAAANATIAATNAEVKKREKWIWILGGISAALILIIGILIKTKIW